MLASHALPGVERMRAFVCMAARGLFSDGFKTQTEKSVDALHAGHHRAITCSRRLVLAMAHRNARRSHRIEIH
jgi:hypothetical protein